MRKKQTISVTIDYEDIARIENEGAGDNFSLKAGNLIKKGLGLSSELVFYDPEKPLQAQEPEIRRSGAVCVMRNDGLGDFTLNAKAVKFKITNDMHKNPNILITELRRQRYIVQHIQDEEQGFMAIWVCGYENKFECPECKRIKETLKKLI